MEYTASNGIRVDSETQGITGQRRIIFGSGTILEMSGAELEALIEALDHERDEELGRWRWPDNPDYVVYAGRRPILVLNEQTGDTLRAHREDGFSDSGHGTIYNAAAAYFEAHPERKPWHDAKPGEVWELTLDDESEHTVFVHADRTVGGRDGVSAGGAYFDMDDANGIVSGRRLWPESD